MSVNEYSREEIRVFINERYSHFKFLIQNKKSFTDPDQVQINSGKEVMMYPQSVSRVVSKSRDRLINLSKNKLFP